MNGPIAQWPPVRSIVEESSLDRTVTALWELPTDRKFAESEARRWLRVSQYLGGAAVVFNYHGAASELAWLGAIALQRAHLAQLTSEIERHGLQETLARAWENARAGSVSWLDVHDWLRSSPRFLIYDSPDLHAEFAWLAQIAAVLWDRTRPVLKEVQHAHA